MALRHENTVSGATLTGGGAVMVWLSLDMGRGAAGATLPPNFFPLICAWGLLICGLILLVRGLRSAAAPLPKLIDTQVAVVGAMVIAFYWWFAWWDFRVGAALLALVTMWTLGIRNKLLLVLLPLGLSIGLYLAFTRGFQLVLPTWT
ncbi:hypothetical protein GCM10007276_05190 [Agaricicola taiwanensis]|uniref:DUF1468 domain-containing protein n=1 Tax=Agaricicola taiwanensis TaxID=591372 RepID=A0A8J2VLC9_9RHOB|nr:tripartite tricarboxylate transporter TctB family protein [Agaricicola taiwanensis]GGE30976.1 hypothetical protein GCM10007276_05190 [Agaricicola taiwanensis]